MTGSNPSPPISYSRAVELVLELTAPLEPVETDLAQATGLVLAGPTFARWDLPSADNSAMDGYAFAWGEQQAGDRLPVKGTVLAGHPARETPAAGEGVRIMTGAPLPPGTDTVVPLEEVQEGGAEIRLLRTPRQGQHVRRRGEELRREEELIAPGTRLAAGEIGLLAAAGVRRVRVHPRPRVALLSTGDELVELDRTPGPGQLVDSNRYLLTARLTELGYPVRVLGAAGDDRRELADRIEEGLGEGDLLLTTGGVSAGDRDLVAGVLADFDFRPGFWRVAVKPGKPVLFGTACGRPCFGLPGNPAAAAATFELFVHPALRRLAGLRDPLAPRLGVDLAAEVAGGEKRRRFVWGRLEEAEPGRYRFHPSLRQGSGMNRSACDAQALLAVPPGSPHLAAGARVEVLLLRLPPGGSLPTMSD